MFGQLPNVHSDILQFFEPGTNIMPGQEVWVPNVLAEFRDPSVAIVYGDGVGHAFVRVGAVWGIAYRFRSHGPNWHGLVSALENNGYRVKHIYYFACETTSNKVGERDFKPAGGGNLRPNQLVGKYAIRTAPTMEPDGPDYSYSNIDPITGRPGSYVKRCLLIERVEVGKIIAKRVSLVSGERREQVLEGDQWFDSVWALVRRDGEVIV
jgi:hypothetical protein